eukprot:7315400-Alexandrium_andersonii.AAC.1
MAGPGARPGRTEFPQLTDAEAVLEWLGPLPTALECLRGRRLRWAHPTPPFFWIRRELPWGWSPLSGAPRGGGGGDDPPPPAGGG